MKHFLKKHVAYSIIGTIVVIALGIILAMYLGDHKQNYSTVTVTSRDLTESVAASGTVQPDQDVSLAFDMQGKVSSVKVQSGDTVHTGDILASLDTGTLRAQMDGATADVVAAEANLAAARRGARPEELALYQQKYDDASRGLVVAMKNAYLQSVDAVMNKADTLFSNGNSSNPTITIRTQSQAEQINIQQERVVVHDKLATWQNTLAALTSPVASSSLIQARDMSTDSLSTVKSFLDHLSLITSNLSSGNSGFSQTTIDGYRSIVNGASQEITGATASEQTAEAAWSGSRDSLTLSLAGSSAETIQAAEAALLKANAGLETLQEEYRHMSIVAPFDGIVTHTDIKIGEVYVPGISANESIGLMSGGAFKIEVYVPETNVGKIHVGNTATITLDAYGPKTPFEATVSNIDPAPTVQNGANGYKTTIRLNAIDDRIKSGLTANATIITKQATSTLAVPTRAIITRGTENFVLLSHDGTFTEQKVETGIASADGYTEIISGLNEGDIIAGFGNN